MSSPSYDAQKCPRYSLLLAGKVLEGMSPIQLDAYILSGIKLFLFTENPSRYEGISSTYDRMHAFVYETQGPVDDLVIGDGQGIEENMSALIRLASKTPNFNLEQYVVEHAPADDLIVVKASAGTGKTTVMIDRLTFLLATQRRLTPQDIALVTFTNKATKNMLEKLEERLMSLFRVSNDYFWLERLESLSSMRLSTVDSFFNDLLRIEGSVLGFGEHSTLRSFVHERKEFIREVINERFVELGQNSMLDENVLPQHVYVDAVFDIWTQLNNRGYYREDIEKVDFGTCLKNAPDNPYAFNPNARINENLRAILVEVEKRYQALKIEENALSVTDLKGEVDHLADLAPTRLHQRPFRYIFIDEFQDTDSSQIRSLCWIMKTMGANLFVVGDEKQSIYRFRGAEETAFKQLKNEIKKVAPEYLPRWKVLGKPITEEDEEYGYVLVKNYRTSSCLTNHLNPVFAAWEKDLKVLPWKMDAVSDVNRTGSFRRVVNGDYPQTPEFRKVFKAVMEHAFEKEKSSNPKARNARVTILVRTNSDVSMVANLCKNMPYLCLARYDGGFYQTEIVRDFMAFLGHMLFPNDLHILSNLVMSPYSQAQDKLDLTTLFGFDGRMDKVRDYLTDLVKDDDWDGRRDRMRTQEFFPCLEGILREINPVQRYAEHLFKINESQVANKDEQIEHYRINLNKLLRLMYESFTGEYVSLLDVYQHLMQMVETNSTEEILYPQSWYEEGGTGSRALLDVVEIMTAHKAKGLEFGTVVMPFTTRPFVPNRQSKQVKADDYSNKPDEETVERRFMAIVDKPKKGKNGQPLSPHDASEPIQVGWRYSDYESDNFEILAEVEDEALRRDEARLLYVALTRAKNHLVVITPPLSKRSSWSEYLENIKDIN